MQHLVYELPRIPLPRLSEKGYEQPSKRGFRRCGDAKMGLKVPFRWSTRQHRRLFRPFSDSLSRLDFSHFQKGRVGYARHPSAQREAIEVPTLPEQMIRALAPFAPLFSKRLWQHVLVLVAGAILAPGCRTVSSTLRAMGLDQEKRFHPYHRVLSRASWSALEASRVLLRLVVETFVP